ncbi:uncharacterized protein LOC108113181 isoform X3 [Drosophila eugracilis]|uniref:uncharacterized protein LOC108113181 isoform X3 n=1 Tax=Drosophila eugracilis TaxID=29029 RepID=UPI001BDB0646|nr:uncharacterized protein LOC108113181 isoform X3 [Drosophila eugracilis]
MFLLHSQEVPIHGTRGGDLRHAHGSRRISGHTAASAGLSGGQCLRISRTVSRSNYQQCDHADAHANAPAEPTANADARHADTWRGLSYVSRSRSCQHESSIVRPGHNPSRTKRYARRL